MKHLILLLAFLIPAMSSFGQAPTTNAADPEARNAEDVISIFSGAYTDVAGTNYNPNWGQAGFGDANTSYDPGTGNLILAYPKFNYQGNALGSVQNISSMEFMHVDIWVNGTFNPRVFAISSGAEVPNEITNTGAGTWISVDIPVAGITGDLTAVKELKFDGGNGTTDSIYVDNVYFWKTATTPQNDATLSDLKIDGETIADFSADTDSYKIGLPSGTTEVPQITDVTTTEAAATTTITQATAIPGEATVEVVSDDESRTKTYTVSFAITTPGVAAPAPPERNAEDVISLFSDAYTDIVVDTFSAVEDNSDITEVMIAGNATKRIDFTNYLQVEFINNRQDASAMTHFHMDFWVNIEDPIGKVFNSKFIDFAGTSEEATAMELNINGGSNPPLQSGTWVSIDVPLDSWANNPSVRSDLAQFVLTSNLDVVYVDNIYMYKNPGATVGLPETFDEASSITTWTTAGDAASKTSEVTLEWAETAGVDASGAMRFGGTNADGAGGRAYILEKTFTDIDFAGETNVDVSVSVKTETISDANVSILTDIAGSIQQNASANTELSDTAYTVFTFNHPSISSGANTVKVQFNVAAGAVVGAGGTLLIDDVSVAPGSGDGGTGAPNAPAGFVSNEATGDGEVFLAAGPNDVGLANIEYKLFYSETASVPADPTTATEYMFGSTAGDGGGEAAFGFNISGLTPGVEYTFWLYQYNSTEELYSDPTSATQTAGGDSAEGDEGLTETFDEASSITTWNTAGDAAAKASEVTFEWAETAGVDGSGAMRFGGTNADGAGGRAYILEKTFTDINFAGETSVDVSVSIKTESVENANISILTDIAGSIQQNASANTELSDTAYTTFTFNHPSISPGANTVKLQFNVAAGAVVDAGGILLIDDIVVSAASSGNGGEGELLTNGDFEAGRAPWTETAGEIRTEGGNSYFFADVATAGQSFDVNLSQVLELTAGETYELSFQASTGAGTTRTMIAGIGLNEGDFPANTETVTLTDQTQTFTYNLVAPVTSANSRVLFDMGAAAGIVVLDNVSLTVGESTTVAEPTTAAPTPPTRNAADVISLFSNAYTNVPVTTWSTDWSQGSANTDIVVEGDDIKRFDFISPFSGVQLESSIDLTNYTHIHIDYWVPDALTAGEVFNPKLSNHGNLPGTDGETNAIEYNNPVTESQTWVSLDVALNDFTVAATNANRDKIYQIILGVAGTLDNVYIDNFYFYKGTSVSNEDLNEGPKVFALDQNYPNPFNPTTNISFSLPTAGEVTLEVYNIQGQKVATLVNGYKSSGSHNISFDASNLASGVYVYRLTSSKSVKVMKMLLIK